ncbi:hypothetical protein T492DRAFT_987362 [Pavlovales sp. CCMP2436]|nr:hypothetical protein T492DRAFT_987362 [Pavlovales sp. CCMP2436]
MRTLIRHRDRRRLLLSFSTTLSLGRALCAHIRCTCAAAEDAEDAEGADGMVLRTHTGPQRRREALACVATVDYGHAAPERNAANERCTKWPSAPGRNAATERRIRKLPWSAGCCSGSTTARVWQSRE